MGSDLPDRMKLVIILFALLGNFNSGDATSPEELLQLIDKTLIKVKEMTETLRSKDITEPVIAVQPEDQGSGVEEQGSDYTDEVYEDDEETLSAEGGDAQDDDDADDIIEDVSEDVESRDYIGDVVYGSIQVETQEEYLDEEAEEVAEAPGEGQEGEDYNGIEDEEFEKKVDYEPEIADYDETDNEE